MAKQIEMKPDYYGLLAVDRDAGESTIKGAFDKLSVQFHRGELSGSPEAEQKFREATEAYKVLSDPLRRSAYDLISGVSPGGPPQEGARFSHGFLNRIIFFAIAIAAALFLLVFLSALGKHLASNATTSNAAPPTRSPEKLAPSAY